MQIRDSEAGASGGLARGWTVGVSLATLLLAWIVLATGGCGKDPALQSIETDAHGYLCLNCGAKLYTGARVFLESKCPKCQQHTLADVTGHWCEKDRHLTIRPRAPIPGGACVCEKCGERLKNTLVSPREKDLAAWGATKTSP